MRVPALYHTSRDASASPSTSASVVNISLLADSTPLSNPSRTFTFFVREFASEEAFTRLWISRLPLPEFQGACPRAANWKSLRDISRNGAYLRETLRGSYGMVHTLKRR